MSSRRGQLRTLAHDAIVAAGTLAGNSVFLPRDWPTNSNIMPAVLIQTPREGKRSRTEGGGIPSYNTTTFLELQCQVSSTVPGTVEDDLETLVDQIELAIMGLAIGPPQYLREISAVEYQMALSAEGATHIGQVTMTFACEYREDFQPVITTPLEGFRIIADLKNPADRLGTYPLNVPPYSDAPPDFAQAVKPAPRTEGPDGRVEGLVDVTFPDC